MASTPKLRWTERILNLDRRVIYAIVFLCVFLPLLVKVSLPFRINQEVRKAYDFVEAMPAGSIVLISGDFGPSTQPETLPVMTTLLHQCFIKKLRPVIVNLVPDGRGMSLKALDIVLNSTNPETGELLYTDLVVGTDYAFLGYKAGGSVVMLALGQSFEATYPKDAYGDPIAGQPIFNEVKSLKDCDLIFDIAAVGYPEYWVSYGSKKYGVPMITACTAVSATQYYPFYKSGQFIGLLNGMRGAAEYEQLMGITQLTGAASATQGLVAQQVTHLFIVFAVVLANLAYLIERRRSKTTRRQA